MARTSARCVTIDCMNINYIEAGSGEPMLLLHGIPTWSYLWREVASALGEKRHVIAPDLLGCGRSEKDEYRDISLSTQTEVVSRFASSHGESMVVVGHDFGACVAVAMALENPRLVSALVLINPPDTETWSRMNLDRYKPAEVARKTTVEMLEGFLRESLPRQLGTRAELSPAALENYLMPWGTPTGMGAFFQMARSVNGSIVEELASRLESLHVPTLVIAGGDDELTPLESCRRISESIRGATVEVLDGVGHLAPEEAPREVVRLIERFLVQVKEGRVGTIH